MLIKFKPRQAGCNITSLCLCFSIGSVRFSRANRDEDTRRTPVRPARELSSELLSARRPDSDASTTQRD